MRRSLKIRFLGGLGEIGMNSLALYTPEGIVLIDAGTMFPPAGATGFQKYVPDFGFVEKYAADVRAIVLTHGHEDHIGALPLLAGMCPKATVFGTEFTLALVAAKLSEFNVSPALEQLVDYRETSVGSLKITPLPVAHNIPHGVALLIESPEGIVLHSGDLKLDKDPMDGRTLNLGKLRERITVDGLDLMLLDSTNATVRGRTPNERSLVRSISEVFDTNSGKRIICSTFASNIHRHQSFIDAAASAGRSTYVVGRSIERNTALAADLGILDVPDSGFAKLSSLHKSAPGEAFVLTTGSQAEPRSGLMLMAGHRHKHVRIDEGDVVVLSSSRVPGNERAIADLVNELLGRGAEVIDIDNTSIHASGHAAADDLRELIGVAAPRALVPIHGERRHLSALGTISSEAGVRSEDLHMCVNGDTVDLKAGSVSTGRRVHSRRVPVDDRFEEVAQETIDEREYLGRHGVLTVSVVAGRRGLSAHSVTQHGWMDPVQFESIVGRLHSAVETAGEQDVRSEHGEAAGVEAVVRRAVGRKVSKGSAGRPRIVVNVIDQSQSSGA